jgi:hypothetical protein
MPAPHWYKFNHFSTDSPARGHIENSPNVLGRGRRGARPFVPNYNPAFGRSANAPNSRTGFCAGTNLAVIIPRPPRVAPPSQRTRPFRPARPTCRSAKPSFGALTTALFAVVVDPPKGRQAPISGGQTHDIAIAPTVLSQYPFRRVGNGNAIVLGSSRRCRGRPWVVTSRP